MALTMAAHALEGEAGRMVQRLPRAAAVVTLFSEAQRMAFGPVDRGALILVEVLAASLVGNTPTTIVAASGGGHRGNSSLSRAVLVAWHGRHTLWQFDQTARPPARIGTV